MDRMIYLSMSGAKATMQRQDTLANHLANVSTPGFRAELQAFRAVPVEGSGASTRVYALETTTGYDASAGPITAVALDLTGATQFGSPFGVTSMAQDGYAAGTLTGVSVENSGIVMATYSNGQSKPAGQLELATFRNPQGLNPQGGNLWARSFASGDPTVGTPATGNIGALQAGALEESNTDLTSELVDMITAQRIYQANAQTIKTQDQILQTIVNLR